jgi:hypothetical protein
MLKKDIISTLFALKEKREKEERAATPDAVELRIQVSEIDNKHPVSDNRYYVSGQLKIKNAYAFVVAGGAPHGNFQDVSGFTDYEDVNFNKFVLDLRDYIIKVCNHLSASHPNTHFLEDILYKDEVFDSFIKETEKDEEDTIYLLRKKVFYRGDLPCA